MSTNYQTEVPKGRVNITLDIETGGVRKKKELPLKVLTLGDFSKGKSQKPLVQRERISINKTNFDDVLQSIKPELIFATENFVHNDGSELKISLRFESIKDFLPQNVAMQVPELRKLIAMRNLLKDLKANVLDNSVLRQELERLMQDQAQIASLNQELRQLTVSE